MDNNDKMNSGSNSCTTPIRSPGEWNEHRRSISFEKTFDDGEYIITCAANYMCLDANVISARQVDKKTPRVCLSTPPNPCNQSHRWRLEKTMLDSGITTYRIITRAYNMNEELELDGNISSHISQWDYSCPSPYLWPLRPNHLNHMWRLVRAPVDKQLFYIVNEQHGKCLDGAVEAASHADDNFKSPYFRQYNPQQRIVLSQLWKVHRIREITEASIPPGYYMIVNVENNYCLDSIGTSEQTTDGQITKIAPRIFVSSNNRYNPALHWYIGGDTNNQFVLIPRFDPEHRELSGKCLSETQSEFFPPHLTHAKSIFYTAGETDHANRRWKLYAAPGIPDAYIIVNMSHGLCLDGNMSVNIQAPFMVRCNLEDEQATSAMWYLKPLKSNEA
jgi:hypothetical protein